MKYYIPALLWAIVILSLSTNAPIELPKFTLLSPDKVGHFAAYCVLTILWLGGIARHKAWQKLHYYAIGIVMLGATLYGTALEFVQAQLPYRSFDYADMLANAIGALLGGGMVVAFKHFFVRVTAHTIPNSKK